MMPSVAVVLVCYNQGVFVRQALDAIFAQRYRDLDIVVIDDCSLDDSAERIETYLSTVRKAREPIFIRNTTNRGLCATLNTALGHVSSQYVAIIAADDWMEPNRIARQVEILEAAGPEFGLVYGDMYLCDQSGRILPSTYYGATARRDFPSGSVFNELLQGNFIAAPSVLMRVSALRMAGAYDESLKSEDYDMWLRMARTSKFAFDSEPLVTYRVRPDWMSPTPPSKDRLAGRIQALRKHLGVDASTDRLISMEIDRYARRLYLVGRSPSETRRDLWTVVASYRTPRTVAYLGAAAIGVRGPWISRIQAVRRRNPSSPRVEEL